MTQLATAVITGVAMLFGYKLIQKQSERQAEAMRATASAARQQAKRVQRDLGALVWDEQAGVYRPHG